jgi:hypothetical protein
MTPLMRLTRLMQRTCLTHPMHLMHLTHGPAC